MTRSPRVAAPIAIICFLLFGSASGQASDRFAEWKWITLLKTTRQEIEKKFGASLAVDKANPAQRYETTSARINIIFAPESKFYDRYGVYIEKNVVMDFIVGVRIPIPIADMPFDLARFEKGTDHRPENIVYLSDELGIRIISQLLPDGKGNRTEQAVAVLYRIPDGAKK